MSNFTREVVEAILEKAGTIAKNETVIGDPITFGDVLIVPVVRVSIGFGAGGGSGSGEDPKSGGSGGGGGGGIRMEPISFLVHDGKSVRVIPATPSKAKGMDSLVEKLPELLTYAMDSLATRGDTNPENKEEN